LHIVYNLVSLLKYFNNQILLFTITIVYADFRSYITGFFITLLMAMPLARHGKKEVIMKALVFKGVGIIALEEVKEPRLKEKTDAIIALTKSAICGTDLHMIRGTIPGMKKGTILGHEGVGIVEKIGTAVKKFAIGDRVIVPSTIACGHCNYCLQGIYSQCDNANPNGPDAGTPFYGGPKESGPFNGMQAEKVRVPYADASLIKIPDTVTDDQVILLSDILPTAYMAVEMASATPSDTVAVFGCGPVGQLVIFCLKQLGVKQIIAIDNIPSRLEKAQQQGCYTINFDKKNPVEELKNVTDKKGPTKIIDAVGIDAEHPQYGLLDFKDLSTEKEFKKELKKIAPKTNSHDGNWTPGNGPSQVLQWAVQAVAKNGVISIIGVYTELLKTFPIGQAMEKNLTLRMGNCNHRKYIPTLLSWVEKGIFDSRNFTSHTLPLNDILTGYKHFDKRDSGWLKVVLSI
jgi:threonine dehydrogenase-like Zn-dependent dehydrogenase